MDWNNLIMWDNVSFNYSSKERLSEKELKYVKKILNSFVNNAYSGYIKNTRMNMSPTIKQTEDHACVSNNSFVIDYNVSGYPSPIPKTFPQDIFKIIPSKITTNDGLVITKSDYYAI